MNTSFFDFIKYFKQNFGWEKEMMMKKLLKIGSLVMVVITVLVAVIALRTYHFAGEFKTIKPHYDGNCLRIDGLPGPEDITIDPKTGIAFISAGDMRTYRAGLPSQGDIYSFDFKTKGAIPKKITVGFDREFHPHGISFYRDPNSGKEYLYAVNHTVKNPQNGHFIEIFEYINGILTHLETISNPLMFSPNDVLAVGPRSFYISNDHGTPHGSKARLFENFVPLKRSYILYYDGQEMRLIEKDIAVVNGLALSADSTTLYAAATLGKAIHAYDRDIASGNIVPSFDINLGTMPDNIELDSAGNIYAATRPKMLTSQGHNKDINVRSPSQVLKITIKRKGDYTFEEIYLNDGKEISSATVAAPFKGGMLLGQAKANHILICTER